MFFMTTGWWRNHRNYVPTDKVQYVEVTQGPVQRWFKTVTTTARTATMVGAETLVIDVPHELASGMAADLHHRSLTSRDALLDGL
jgi:membrane protein YdbS with pleckstrin-like domain